MAETGTKSKNKAKGKAKAPAAKAPAAASSNGQEAVEFGVSNIADHIAETTGKRYKTRDLRTQIRRMAKDGRVQREVIPGNKTRYDWKGGLEHPEVKAIIAAVAGGEIEAGRKTALDNLKKTSAAKKAKEKATAGPDDDEDVEEDDDSEEDDDDE